ncbi:5212_t:CDS:2, partial [Ambispora gerdemannii]
MATYTSSDGYSFVRTFSNISKASATTVETVDVVPKRMPEYHYYRTMWWEKGDFNPKANWEEATLPYKLAVGVTLEEYEERSDKFNIRGYWEWVNGDVIIYELPSKPHEVFIVTISEEIFWRCSPVRGTDGSIIGLGAIRTRADDSEKEGDASFRPEKPRVRPPNGSDGKGEPWPNIVIEVAYFESKSHVLEKVKDFWLRNWSRAHDAIVVKIDKPPEEDQAPLRMQFEFGTHDKNGNLTNIQPGQCVINISLDCLYHDAFPEATTHRQLLPDPI